MIGHEQELTPFELRDGRWFKREDLYAGPDNVNGAKYRQCGWIVDQLKRDGAERLVTGASVRSPQHAIAALHAERAGLPLVCCLGKSTPDSAVRHRSVAIAVKHGATLDFETRVAYNPQIQRRVHKLAEQTGAGVVPYGLGLPDEVSDGQLRSFHSLGARQLDNLPEQVDELIIPFGSGNSAASVLYGLMRPDRRLPGRLLLVGIGPSRLQWLYDRLSRMHRPGQRPPGSLPLVVVDLHGAHVYAYDDSVRFVESGIRLHPTYEAKVAEWLHDNPSYSRRWAARDGTACLWIVGGPL